MANSESCSKYCYFIQIMLLSWICATLLICQVHNPESLFKHILQPADYDFLNSKIDLNRHPARFEADSMYHVYTDFTFHDIYREWLNDKLILSSEQYDAGTMILLPFSYSQKPGVISLKFNYSNFSFKDKAANDDADASINQWPLYTISGTTGLQSGKHRLGLSALFSYGNTQSEVNIKKYYHDPDDDLINRYFYDLLYSTFGENIEFKPVHKYFKFAGEYIHTVNDHISSGLLFDRLWVNNKYSFSYINSTDRLAGEKKLEAPLDGDTYKMQWMNEFFYQPLTIRTEIEYEKSDILFTLTALNPTKSGNIYLDIRNLADIPLSSEKIGGGLSLEWKIKKTMDLNLSIAAGENSIHGQGEVKTPVLGFELLPIAHQFEGKFDFDIKSWSYGLDWNHNIIEKLGYKINLEYIDGKGILNYDNLAKMEFGIGTSRFLDKIYYQIDMYRASISLNYRIFTKYILFANIEQIFPDIIEKEKEKTTLPSAQSTKKERRDYWGGSVYTIGLNYIF